MEAPIEILDTSDDEGHVHKRQRTETTLGSDTDEPPAPDAPPPAPEEDSDDEVCFVGSTPAPPGAAPPAPPPADEDSQEIEIIDNHEDLSDKAQAEHGVGSFLGARRGPARSFRLVQF